MRRFRQHAGLRVGSFPPRRVRAPHHREKIAEARVAANWRGEQRETWRAIPDTGSPAAGAPPNPAWCRRGTTVSLLRRLRRPTFIVALAPLYPPHGIRCRHHQLRRVPGNWRSADCSFLPATARLSLGLVQTGLNRGVRERPPRGRDRLRVAHRIVGL